ncbi:hypothetical protein [Actinokineospora sp. UTMC 2448]|uniref:hypothetical protein n=1 Tax=Actinokineospora sp. UTMC 2448 TaxID=2268449 RepID=UPI0021649948|nr:hypothetical protein [Actinokineospora sp. UTMC 2448]UVS78730.1 hypothetical protein Actkin_02466 [Actinokineospora sp. UTMC 2448]
MTALATVAPSDREAGAAGPPLIVAAKLLRWLRFASLLIAMGTLYGLALPLLMANTAVYTSLPRQVWAFCLLTAVALVAGCLIAVDRLAGWPRWVLLAAVAAASGLATTGIRADHLTAEAEWSYGVIGWFAMVLLLDRGRAAAAFLVAHTVVSFAQAALLGQDVVGMVVVAAIVLGCQSPVLAGALALRRIADDVAAARRAREEVRTAEAVAERLHESRLARYADLAGTTVPLLERLTDGSADLSDARVRADYTAEAAKLRRLFAENDDVPDPLLHELEACVDLAQRRGIAVYLGTCGEWVTPPLAVRRALIEPVVWAASAATAARVTVIGSAEGVTVSVVADAPADVAPQAEAPVAVTRMVDGTRVWVEAAWRR